MSIVVLWITLFLVDSTRIEFPKLQSPFLISRGNIHITDHRELFFLDTYERTISHFNQRGELIKVFSRKGKGPGELEYPRRLNIHNDLIIVQGLYYVSLFTLDGEPISKTRKPTNARYFYKIDQGWLVLTGPRYQTADADNQLIVYSEDFDELEVLGSWPGNGRESFKNLLNNVQYPFPNSPIMFLDRRSELAILMPVSSEEVYVYDLKAMKLRTKIEFPGPLLPFNEVWGEEWADKLKKKNPSSKYVFPEHFPKISYINITKFNNLAIYTYNGDASTSPNYFDLDGNPMQPLPLEFEGRAIAVRNDIIYTTMIIEDDISTIVGVHKKDFATFIAENPYEAEPHFEMPKFQWGN